MIDWITAIFKFIITWLLIGVIYNFIISKGKMPGTKNWNHQDSLDWKYDVLGGPLSIFFFVVFVIIKLIKKHKNGF